MTLQNQRHAQYYQQYSQVVGAEKTQWDALLDTTVAAFAKMARRRSGSLIFDSTTTMELKCYYNIGLAQRVWAGANCSIQLFIAGEAITKNRFVTLDNGTIGEVIVPVNAGDIHGGVALNSAAQDEIVYVMTAGVALVELSNPLVAITQNARVTTDTDGKALAVGDDEFYMSYCLTPDLTINAVRYARVQVALPVHTPAVIP